MVKLHLLENLNKFIVLVGRNIIIIHEKEKGFG